MPTIFGFKLFKKNKQPSNGFNMNIDMRLVGASTMPAYKTKQRRPVQEIMRTCVLMMAFMAWGMTISVVMATREDLRIRLDVTDYSLSYAAAIGAMGIITGGMFSALADRFPQTSDLQVGAMLITGAIAFVYIPYCRSLETVGICHLIVNLAFFAMHAAAHSQISALWTKGCKSARYALYLALSIGLATGTLIAKPFTSGQRAYDKVEEEETNTDDVTTQSHDVTTTQRHFYILSSPSRDESTIEYAYLLVFSLILVVAALMVVCFFLGIMSNTLKRLEKRGQKQSWSAVINPAKWAGGNGKIGVTMVILVTLWCLLQKLHSAGLSTYLVRFALDIGMRPDVAAWLPWCFFAAGIVSRGLGIVAVRLISVRMLFLVVIAGQILISLLCTVLCTKSTTSLWVLVLLLAFFSEAAIPTVLAWTGHYIYIYGVLIGFIELVSSLAQILYMPLQDSLYHKHGLIESIFYATLVFSVLQLVLTLIMNWFGAQEGSRRRRRSQEYLSERKDQCYVPYVAPEPIILCVGNEAKPMSQSSASEESRPLSQSVSQSQI